MTYVHCRVGQVYLSNRIGRLRPKQNISAQLGESPVVLHDLPETKSAPSFIPSLSGHFLPLLYNILSDVILRACQASLLKVLTNQKRGGLTVVSFERSRFKLLSRKFSKKLVQAPSCERPKTTQRTLFLPFEINMQLFPNNGKASGAYEKIQETCMTRGRFKHR